VLVLDPAILLGFERPDGVSTSLVGKDAANLALSYPAELGAGESATPVDPGLDRADAGALPLARITGVKRATPIRPAGF